MIPQNAKYIIPKSNWPDYGFKAGKKYKVKVNIEVGRYIDGDGPTYLDNHELRPEVIADFSYIL